MNQLLRAIKALPKKGEHNLLKIFSLSLGLVVSLVLLSKVFFDNSYDTFVPDNERIYRIQYKYKRFNENTSWGESYTKTPGGIAYYAQRDIPFVEASTRYTSITSNKETSFFTSTREIFKAAFTLVDSSFFRVFDLPIIIGDPSVVLSTPNQIMISDKLASKLGGDPIGQMIEINNFPGVELEVAGIYKSIPNNSSLELDVLISMPTIGKFMWDGSKQILGNDRYQGFVKLAPNTNVQQANTAIYDMMDKYVDWEEVRKMGVEMRINIQPLVGLHADSEAVRTMTRILVILSVVILLIAVLNYLLMVISSMVERSKEMALHRCYGASVGKIYAMTFAQGFVHISLALVGAIVMLFAFREIIERLVDISIVDMFNIEYSYPLIVLCVLIWIVTSTLPAVLFSKIPVTAVFRLVSSNRKMWKLTMLFFQFSFSAFVLMILWVSSRQYDMMVSEDIGYTHENIIYASITSVKSSEERQRIQDEMSKLTGVAEVSGCSNLPFFGANGNNILDREDITLFNVADLYNTNDNYLNFMNVEIIGGGFDALDDSEVMVSRRFTEKMVTLAEWESEQDAIGKQIHITEHGFRTVCGVYEDFRIGSLVSMDIRPSVMFSNREKVPKILLLKLENTSAQLLRSVNNKLQELAPDSVIELFVWGDKLEYSYNDWLNFRDMVLYGSIVALLITLMGLMGYINNEINRRTKEMAIRKINGALIVDIIVIFSRQILVLALFAFTLGVILAFVVGDIWQQQFAQKADMHWFVGIAVVVMLFALISSIIAIKCLKLDRENPVVYLKS